MNKSKGESPRDFLSVQALHIPVEVTINASQQRVWQALSQEIDTWWPKDFYGLKNTIRFVLEAKLGGHMYEDAGEGNGAIWATVRAIDPPNSISLSGSLAPPFGGPATSLLRIELTSLNAHKTTIHITDAVFGHLAQDSFTCITDGWRTIFEQGLKAYLENN